MFKTNKIAILTVGLALIAPCIIEAKKSVQLRPFGEDCVLVPNFAFLKRNMGRIMIDLFIKQDKTPVQGNIRTLETFEAPKTIQYEGNGLRKYL